MKKTGIIILGLFLLSSTIINADEKENKNEIKTSITGTVQDQTSGEILAGVKINIQGTKHTVFSDFNGNFEIKNIKTGKCKITTSYISYKDNIQLIDIKVNETNDYTIEIQNISTNK